MASGSQIACVPPPSSTRRWKYDVFLSFRGPDTRKGITADIYKRLDNRGINTFMDDRNLEVGNGITPALLAAIKNSRFAIVVLSPTYASSAWCLEELREICLSMEDNRIFPLFYEVDPTDVRYQKQSFGEAFSEYETSGRHKPEKVNEWRAALNKVANISGWKTKDHRAHHDLVDLIVEVLHSKLAPEAIESTGDFQAFEATKEAMNEVMKALKDDEVTAVGVYGMGGVGKTTLVEHIGALARRTGIFDHVIKCVVSQNPDFEKLQKELAEQLGFQLHEETELGRAKRLQKEIMRKTNILIILDDIWKEIKLSTIGIPSFKELQNCNSKVLLTTRIRNVCHAMECQRRFTLNVLSEQDSWTLFEEKARRYFESPTFEDVAKKVARECRGLPIALITVARALGDKDLREWRIAAQRLEKSQTANADDYGEAFECIKLSYDYLRNEEYKSYFLLCCLFPEDHYIPIEHLFRYAIGKGLFRDAETLQEERERAESLAMHLQHSCLLLESIDKRYVRMHDVVRDAAIQIAQSEHGFLVKAGCGLKDWPYQLHEDCSAISLMDNHISKLPKRLVCPKLQILLLNDSDMEEIPETFFQSPNELRVFDLSQTSISLLPQSFSLLTNLQALYLDWCEHLRIDTSTLGKLKKLEILSMRMLSLKELSMELGDLTNLRIFNISDGNIARIPPNVISKWHKLEELYIKGFGNWGSKMEGEGDETNAGFEEVISLSKLRVLNATILDANCIPKDVDIIPSWVEVDISIGKLVSGWMPFSLGCVIVWSIYLELDKLSRLPEWFRNEIMKRADTLYWEGCESFIDIVVEDEYGRLPGLKHLKISKRVRQRSTEVNPVITSWVPKRPVLEILEVLNVERLDWAEFCAVVEVLPPGSLFNLKVLKVTYSYNWGNIFFPSSTLQRLPNLEQINAYEMDNSKYVFRYDAFLRPLTLEKIDLLGCDTVGICEGPAPPTMFQNLQTLIICDCKFERSLFTYDVAQYLPQLIYLELENCPQLERIVEASKSNEKTIIPKLEELSLTDLPKFCYESDTIDIECPSLEYFWVEDCPKFSASASDFHSRKQVKLEAGRF